MRPQDVAQGPHTVAVTVEAAGRVTPEIVQALLDIDLQTFSEPTLTAYTAAVFLDQGRVFLLRVDGAVIGATVLVRSWATPTEVTLVSMGIRPGWRGQGLGQRFVQGVAEQVAAEGATGITLLVPRDNRRALKVYEDVGFRRRRELEAEPYTADRLVVLHRSLEP